LILQYLTLSQRIRARNRAQAIAALCIGGMVLARSIEDRALADEIREAAMGVALSLGQWPRRTSAEMRQDSTAALELSE
jgi:hypothetical protein